MGRVFRASLSSFGAGLESGFGSGLSALDVGFDSGSSGFDFTCDRSPVPPPSARRQSRKGVGIRCTGAEEEGSLEPFKFAKKREHSPRKLPSCSRQPPARSISTRRRGRCAVLLKNGRAATHLEVVRKAVRGAEIRWGKYAELQPRGQDFPFRTRPKSHLLCDTDLF